MQKKFDRSDILNRVTDIRSQKKNFYSTNIFSIPDPDKIIDVRDSESGISFLIDDKGVKRGYFAANDMKTIPSLLAEFPSGTGIEILTKTEDSSLDEVICQAECELYATYLRLSNNQLLKTFETCVPEKFKNVDWRTYVTKGSRRYLNQIYEYLYEIFNPLTSHLQDREELKVCIDQGEIVLGIKNGEVVAVLTYRFEGKKLYMEHMANRGESVFMHALYYSVLERAIRANINSVYTWIRQDNARALAFAGRYGLKPDGMKNKVFIKK